MPTAGAGHGLPRRDLVQLAWLGILGHTLHVSMVTFGIHWSTAFSSALIMACSPVFTLLILHWAGIEALSRGQVAGVALACAGVLIFLSDKLLGGNFAATGGDLMMLLAASFFSYYTVMSKPLIQRHGGKAVMAHCLLAGSPLIVLGGCPPRWTHPGRRWAPGTGACCCGPAWCRPSWAGWSGAGSTRTRGVARTAPLQYLMPLVAGLVAWVGHRRALHRPEDRRRPAHPGRRGLGPSTRWPAGAAPRRMARPGSTDQPRSCTACMNCRLARFSQWLLLSSRSFSSVASSSACRGGGIAQPGGAAASTRRRRP